LKSRRDAHQVGKVIASASSREHGLIEIREWDRIVGAASRADHLAVRPHRRDARIPLVPAFTAFAGPKTIIVEHAVFSAFERSRNTSGRDMADAWVDTNFHSDSNVFFWSKLMVVSRLYDIRCRSSHYSQQGTSMRLAWVTKLRTLAWPYVSMEFPMRSHYQGARLICHIYLFSMLECRCSGTEYQQHLAIILMHNDCL